MNVYFPKFVKSSAAKTTTSPTSKQDADKEAKNVTWMITAMVFLVVAILLAITSIALGTILCVTRKSVKSKPASKLSPHQGKSKATKLFVQKQRCEFWINQWLRMSMQSLLYVNTCTNVYITGTYLILTLLQLYIHLWNKHFPFLLWDCPKQTFTCSLQTLMLLYWLNVYVCIVTVICVFLIQIFATLEMDRATLWIVGRWLMRKLLFKRVLITENPKWSSKWSKNIFLQIHICCHTYNAHMRWLHALVMINCFSGSS